MAVACPTNCYRESCGSSVLKCYMLKYMKLISMIHNVCLLNKYFCVFLYIFYIFNFRKFELNSCSRSIRRMLIVLT